LHERFRRKKIKDLAAEKKTMAKQKKAVVQKMSKGFGKDTRMT